MCYKIIGPKIVFPLRSSDLKQNRSQAALSSGIDKLSDLPRRVVQVGSLISVQINYK